VEKYCTARQITGDNMIQHMHIACWITMAKDTHPECVIIIALPQQLWLHKCTSIYVYTYTACLVFSVLCNIYHSCQEFLKDDSNNSYF
jgi:hypothetical protein